MSKLWQKQKDVSEAEPIWLEAREVRFVQDRFASEQSSLVLDVIEGKPSKQAKLSEGQQQCVDVLAELLNAGTFVETDDDGSRGVKSDVLRRDCGRWQKLL